MSTLKIKEIYKDSIITQEATIKGWVKSLRKNKAFSFVVLNDGSSQRDIQIVVDGGLENYDEIIKCNTGSSMAVTGKLVESQGKIKSIEMQATSVHIYCQNGDDYPIQKKKTSFEFLREIAHLRPRTNSFGAVARVRHRLAMATHQFFDSKGFFYLNTPIITGVDAEGAGEMFRVSSLDPANPPKNDKGEVDYDKDYFGKETYLTVTGQLQAEAYALGMGSVYTFGPTFRSENSNTARHLAEFWMVEPEVAFADLDDVATLGADYIKFMIEQAFEHCPEELAFFDQRIEKGLIDKLTKVKDSEFKKITYTQAVDILIKSNQNFEYKVEWGVDLSTEHERFLSEKHFEGPVIVTDYPKEIKAFYMKLNHDGKTVRAMDILVPGVGEILGGSQREDNLEKLLPRMKEVGLKEQDYWWYLDLRKFGSAPHAGFGLGFERALMYITGMSNIRDVIAFPRTPKNADF
jgi:asparaginyl-tRNA synthetase